MRRINVGKREWPYFEESRDDRWMVIAANADNVFRRLAASELWRVGDSGGARQRSRPRAITADLARAALVEAICWRRPGDESVLRTASRGADVCRARRGGRGHRQITASARPAPIGSYGVRYPGRTRQNSFPSGSSITIHENSPITLGSATRVAPRHSRRRDSASRSWV